MQLPLARPSLETIEVLRDDYVVVSCAESVFPPPGRTPTLREIAEQPLIGYRYCRSTEILVDQLRATGREPHFVFRSDENGVVQGLAGAGIGIAVIPRLAVDMNDAAVRITELGPRVAPRQIGIARHKDRYHSTAAKSFLETALEVCTETAAALAA